MIHNVIPINYCGGLGGQFLSSFLYAARENRPINWTFSKNGNAHDTINDYAPPHGLAEDLTGMLNINALIEYSKTIPKDKIAFAPGHFADPDLLMNYVNKQIKIYFEPNQLDEVTGVFMLKHDKTPPFTDLTDPSEIERYKNHNMIKWAPIAATKFARFYNNCPDLEPRMLNISWNDMLYNDPEILISKLHQFTQIPIENFNREKFAEWRMLTLNTVNRLKQAGLI